MEGNKHTFGLYLPTLFGLRNILEKYANIETTETLACSELAKAIKAGFERRFGQLMDVNDSEGKSAPLYIAMITNPQFKMNFMGSKTIHPNVLRQLKEMLVSAAIDIEESKSLPQLCEKPNNDENTAAIVNGNINCKLIFFMFLVFIHSLFCLSGVFFLPKISVENWFERIVSGK